jgi:hypothetical protein
MTPDERCEQALGSQDPERALRALVQDLAREGGRKEDLYALLERLVLRLRARGDEREDAVLIVMDALTDWRHPSARLLADEPPAGGRG